MYRIFLLVLLQQLHAPVVVNGDVESSNVDLLEHLDFDIGNLQDISEKVCILFNVSLSDCHKNFINLFFNDENGTNITTLSKYKRSEYLTVAYASFAVTASIFGTVGNAAVLLMAYKQRNGMSSCRLHIAELAVTNFIFSIAQVINTVPLYWTNSWVYGLLGCKLVRTLLEAGSILSIAFIQIIAIERFYLIVYPFQSQINKGRFKHTLVIASIILVMGTVTPYFMSLNIEESTGRCVLFYGGMKRLFRPYIFFVLTAFSILPICSLTVLSIKMICHLSDYFKKAEGISKSYELLLFKRNRRIMFVTLVVLSMLILSTLPTRIITIYVETTGHKTASNTLYVTLTLVSYFTFPIQSILNPILYSMTAKKWRQDFKRSLLPRTEGISLTTYLTK